MRAGGSLSDALLFQMRKPLPCPLMWRSPQGIALSLSSMKAPLPMVRTPSLMLSGTDYRSRLAPKLSWGFFWRSWPRLTLPATTLPGPHLCTLLSGFIFSHAPVPSKAFDGPVDGLIIFHGNTSNNVLFNPMHWKCFALHPASSICGLSLCASPFSHPHLLHQGSPWDKHARNTWEAFPSTRKMEL